jgi:hypothetical protein
MPILDLQTRARELGRIRLGQVVTANGKTRPEKVDRFRFTSYSRELLDQVAALYGGTVGEWQPQGNGARGFEVLTDARRVPILVPPQPVSQWYELWSGGGCQRRCDGTTEQLTDRPCVCDPDPEERECKPTTRLNVMLRDVPGLGVWRLESHGYYAAVELPAVAEFLAAARGYVPAALLLEERTAKRGGQTRRYMVPAIEVEQITPAQLMSGAVQGMQPAEIAAAEPAAIEAGRPDWGELVAGATTRDELLAIREQAKAAGATDVDDMLRARAAELGVTKPDVDALWTQILTSAPDGWTTGDVETDFHKVTGVTAEAATSEDMQRYLTAVKV